MADVNRVDLLWKIVLRYDAYIGTTNAKAAFLIAWNTFLLGTVVVKGSDFVNQLQGSTWVARVSAALLILLAAAALISLRFTFSVVSPYLKSPKRIMVYHSLVFFNHVAEFEDEIKYHDSILKCEEENVVRDLAYQAHVLAKGLKDKFSDLRVAIGVVLFVQIPTALATLFLFIASKFI